MMVTPSAAWYSKVVSPFWWQGLRLRPGATSNGCEKRKLQRISLGLRPARGSITRQPTTGNWPHCCRRVLDGQTVRSPQSSVRSRRLLTN